MPEVLQSAVQVSHLHRSLHLPCVHEWKETQGQQRFRQIGNCVQTYPHMSRCVCVCVQTCLPRPSRHDKVKNPTLLFDSWRLDIQTEFESFQH